MTPYRLTAPAYSIRIPHPSFDETSELEQIAQFRTCYNDDIEVFWCRSRKQVILHMYTDRIHGKGSGTWYIQPDGYITDSLAELIPVKESQIRINNLSVGHSYDMTTFRRQDAEMTNNFYSCTWSDYACDHLIMQGDLNYPWD